MEKESISRFIEKLPREIINEIIPYTYNSQKKEILDDIKSFFFTRDYLFYLYLSSYYFLHNDLLWLEWLDNDILRFLYNDVPQTFGLEFKKDHIYHLTDHIRDYIRDYLYNNMQNNPIKDLICNNIASLDSHERKMLIQHIHRLQFILDN